MRHMLLTVKDRRWCVCCDLFQSRPSGGNFPAEKDNCPNDVLAAVSNRRVHALADADKQSRIYTAARVLSESQ